MPELTASTKIVLGSVAAAAALITGLLGNVLAANISAFFSGTPPKAAKRPTILWLAFFVSASLSVVAGSVATFSPVAPANPTATPAATASPAPTASPIPTGVNAPKVVITNAGASMLAQNPRNLMIVCRDTVELANTSDIATSLVAVGTDLQVDGTLLKIEPTENLATASQGQVSVAVRPWRTAPDTRAYGKLRALDQFGAIQGGPLPIKIDARSTVAVYVDYALQFSTALPRSISAVHLLRFPDIADLKTSSVKCQ